MGNFPMSRHTAHLKPPADTARPPRLPHLLPQPRLPPRDRLLTPPFPAASPLQPTRARSGLTHRVTPAKLVNLPGQSEMGQLRAACTDGRPPENTPAWIASHQSSFLATQRGQRISTSRTSRTYAFAAAAAALPAATESSRRLISDHPVCVSLSSRKPSRARSSPLHLDPPWVCAHDRSSVYYY